MYSISSVLLLSLLSSLSPIECYDWCPLIRQPDGTYNGLTLYNKFNRYRDIEHWMNNRNNSVEWRFHITADGILIPDEGSVINTDTDFSFELMPHLVYKWNDSQTINCKMVVTFANNSIIDLICLIFDGKDTNDVRINDLATTQMLKQLIFIGPHLVMTTELIPSYLQVNRHDRQAKIAHILTPSPPFYWKYVCKDHRYPDRDICDNWFVDKLSDDLFKSLDSSLKFNDSEILLFNIDNRPKFCIQKDRRELSEGVSHKNCHTMSYKNSSLPSVQVSQHSVYSVWRLFSSREQIFDVSKFGNIYHNCCNKRINSVNH